MMTAFLVGVLFACLLALVVVRKSRHEHNTVLGTVTESLAEVVMTPELRARMKHIKYMRRRIRWASRRMEWPYMCKKSTRVRAMRYLQEAYGSEQPEVRSYARVYINRLMANVNGKIKMRLEAILTPPKQRTGIIKELPLKMPMQLAKAA